MSVSVSVSRSKETGRETDTQTPASVSGDGRETVGDSPLIKTGKFLSHHASPISERTKVTEMTEAEMLQHLAALHAELVHLWDSIDTNQPARPETDDAND